MTLRRGLLLGFGNRLSGSGRCRHGGEIQLRPWIFMSTRSSAETFFNRPFVFRAYSDRRAGPRGPLSYVATRFLILLGYCTNLTNYVRFLSAAALIVFLRSIATVSGPTPPGTGVSQPASGATSS